MGGMGCQTCYDTPCTCPKPFDDEEMLRVGNTLPYDLGRLFADLGRLFCQAGQKSTSRSLRNC